MQVGNKASNASVQCHICFSPNLQDRFKPAIALSASKPAFHSSEVPALLYSVNNDTGANISLPWGCQKATAAANSTSKTTRDWKSPPHPQCFLLQTARMLRELIFVGLALDEPGFRQVLGRLQPLFQTETCEILINSFHICCSGYYAYISFIMRELNWSTFCMKPNKCVQIPSLAVWLLSLCLQTNGRNTRSSSETDRQRQGDRDQRRCQFIYKAKLKRSNSPFGRVHVVPKAFSFSS